MPVPVVGPSSMSGQATDNPSSVPPTGLADGFGREEAPYRSGATRGLPHAVCSGFTPRAKVRARLGPRLGRASRGGAATLHDSAVLARRHPFGDGLPSRPPDNIAGLFDSRKSKDPDQWLYELIRLNVPITNRALFVPHGNDHGLYQDPANLLIPPGEVVKSPVTSPGCDAGNIGNPRSRGAAGPKP